MPTPDEDLIFRVCYQFFYISMELVMGNAHTREIRPTRMRRGLRNMASRETCKKACNIFERMTATVTNANRGVQLLGNTRVDAQPQGKYGPSGGPHRYGSGSTD